MSDQSVLRLDFAENWDDGEPGASFTPQRSALSVSAAGLLLYNQVGLEMFAITKSDR